MDGLYHWWDIMTGAVGSIIASFLGVAMRYAHQTQHGVKFEWWRVWLEGPTVMVMGIAAFAAREFWALPESVSYFGASMLGYLGPKAVTLALGYIQKRVEKEKDDN